VTEAEGQHGVATPEPRCVPHLGASAAPGRRHPPCSRLRQL